MFAAGSGYLHARAGCPQRLSRLQELPSDELLEAMVLKERAYTEGKEGVLRGVGADKDRGETFGAMDFEGNFVV